MTEPTRFTRAQRWLHWTMAVCILTMLFLGVGMVSTVAPKYLMLVEIHKPLGIAILILAVFRVILRFTHTPPRMPDSMSWPDRMGAELSVYVLYALMIAMPLIGWGMLSAASHPVTLAGGFHLPAILPVSAKYYTVLRQAHIYLAFAFFVFILMHVSAILFHKLVRNDGIFEMMASTGDEGEK